MESPVFYDRTGRRWKVVKAAGAAGLLSLIALLAWIGPQVLSSRPVGSLESPPGAAITAAELVRKMNQTTIAVIGEGSLVRIIEATEKDGSRYAVDPFTGRELGPLTEDEVSYIGSDTYAVQRFGHTESRKIALTFDDGPDEIYTPRLLDILSRESVPATFFVVGSNVARSPEIADRLAREGHAIGNHTFSHIDFAYAGPLAAAQQINQTQRTIAAATGKSSVLFRPPYAGRDDQALRTSLIGIAEAQRLGYTTASYNFDSLDWRFNNGMEPRFPPLEGESHVVLLHDGGGGREKTLAYVQELITRAKNAGYTFANLEELYAEVIPAAATVTPTLADYASLRTASTLLVLPRILIHILFGISLTLILFTTVFNITLSVRQHRRLRRLPPANDDYRPAVDIIVPAYNEGKVLIRTVRSLLSSDYENIRIVIVDDGSTDSTWEIAQSLARTHPRVAALHQSNGGKSSALNNAIGRSRAEIIVCVDADTIFPPVTISKFVRHFRDETVGAVAGVVKVGNVRSMTTRWQALEYAISISIDRNAHASLGSIMIIPGACGAWRRTAVLKADGFSHSTLAEDCDLTIKIQELNKYRILQDNEAVSYTEAPQAIRSLMKQRFRWTFGNIQSLWKHRNMIDSPAYGWMGMFVMPNAFISILMPLLFWPLLLFISIQNIISGNYAVILIYFSISLGLQFIIAAIGLKLAGERLSYLVAVPYARFVYGPIRMYILYRTLLTALRGSYVGWNKLVRTGSATYRPASGLAPAKHRS